MAGPVTSGALAHWRWRLTRRRPVREVVVPIAGASESFMVVVPAEPGAVLDDTARAFVAAGGHRPWHIPYWATPWASGIAVAEAVVADPDPFRGRRVLELGCGLGITAMALAAAGANLVVVDVWPDTLAYCRYNASRHAGPSARVRTLLADWREVDGQERLHHAGRFDVVVAADVLYEKEDVAPLLDLLPRLVTAGGVAWLAEPRRTTSQAFVDRAAAAGWRSTVTEVTRDPWPADAGRATVRIHRYSMIPGPSETVR